MKKLILAALMIVPSGLTLVAQVGERVFRPERYSRGDLGVRRCQPIDDAAWVWHPGFAAESCAQTERYLRLRRAFTSPGAWARIDVSADERFVLLLDGRIVGRGPNRGSVENWTYQTYDIEIPAGDHVMEAIVWRIGEKAPLAQLSYRGGFIVKAEGVFDALLTTGKADWQVGELKGTVADESLDRGETWGAGAPFTVSGTDLIHEQPSAWTNAVVVRKSLHPSEWTIYGYGLRARGWLLYPSALPDQTDRTKSGKSFGIWRTTTVPIRFSRRRAGGGPA